MNKPDYPKDLKIPVLLMASPFVSAYNNEHPNNPLMTGREKIDYNKAFMEWLGVYRFLSEHGLVYLLPNEGWYQDQIYVANLGLVLHHLKEPTVILSNFMSLPRRGEEGPGYHFFGMMKYKCERPDSYFEGEADCKFLRNNLYIGGYGIRTSILTYQWMQDKFDCRIVPVQMCDKKLYHWDTIFFPLNDEAAIVNESVLADSDISLLEKYVEIIDVPKAFKYSGITNLCRINSTILCRDLEPAGKKWLDKVCNRFGYDAKYFPLDSQDSNGADLSCLIMRLNKPNLSTGQSVVAGIKNFLTPRV